MRAFEARHYRIRAHLKDGENKLLVCPRTSCSKLSILTDVLIVVESVRDFADQQEFGISVIVLEVPTFRYFVSSVHLKGL